MSSQNKTNNGFSIIEVIVFTAMMSVVLVAAVGYTVRLVFTMTHNRHRLLATHYVEEVKEWLNGERETDWQVFQSNATVVPKLYCLNAPLQLDDTLASLPTGTCDFTGIVGVDPQIYQRRLFLSKNVAGTADRVTAVIQVSWRDEGVLYTEEIETVYSVWE